MSTRYNTGNPIESTDVRDMSDNAKNFDEFSNSTETTFTDRFGVARKTLPSLISKAEQDIYYALINAGFQPASFDFVTGGTLAGGERNKAVFNPSPTGDDNWYAWQGALPKTISPKSTPAASGGLGENAWKPVTNNILAPTVMESIRRSYAEAGYNLVDGSFEAGGTLVNANDVLLYEAKGEAYSYTGTLPHTVNEDSSPSAEPGMWVDRSTAPNAFKQSGSGAVMRTAQDKEREIFSVDDFGATGNGVTNDSSAVSLAIAATPIGGAIRFSQNKTYVINGVTLSGKSITILAHGATIKGPAGVRVPGYFDFSGAGDIKIVGANVDLMHGSIQQYVPADYPNEYNRLFYGTGANSVTIDSCNIKNLYNTVISSYQVGMTKVINNTFHSKSQDQDQVLDYIKCTTGAELVVEGNEFNSAAPTSAAYGTCAVFASGITKSVTVRGNRFKNCGRDNTGSHRLGVVDFYFDVKNINVSDNIADDCWAQFSRVSSCATGKIVDNVINVNGGAEPGYTIISIESVMIGAAGRACSDILVAGNTFNDPFNRHETHVGVYSYDWGLSSKNIRVKGNVFNGAKNMALVVGPYRGVEIIDNQAYGYIGKIAVKSESIPALTSNQGLESNAILDNLVIDGNTIIDAGSGAVTIDIDMTKTPAYSGSLGDISITRNILKNNTSSSPYGLNLKGHTNKSGSLVSCNNSFRGYAKARSVSNIAYVEDTYNKAFNGGGLEISGVTSFMRRFNSDFGGSISGIATLVAGAVTVTTGEIKSTDLIALTIVSTSGTVGVHYIDSKTPNSNFVIKSTSATDGSTLLWEIQHIV